MKTTRSAKLVSEIEHLNNLIKTRLSIEKEEREIKKRLKDYLQAHSVMALAAGQYVVVITDRQRRELDKEHVQTLLGAQYDECLFLTFYQTLEIKKA